MSVEPIPFTENGQMLAAINGLRFGPDFAAQPEAFRDKLATITANPVVPQVVSEVAELVYAFRDQVSEPALIVGIQAAHFAAANGWFGMGVEGRGIHIARALRVKAGETVAGYEPESDPTPALQFVPPAPVFAAPPQAPEPEGD